MKTDLSHHPLIKLDAVYPDFILPLLIQATNLKKAGHTARIIDMRAQGINLDMLKDHIRLDNPGSIVVYTFTYGRLIAIDLIRELKEAFPNKPIIGDGLHFNMTARDALDQIQELDAVVIDPTADVMVQLAQKDDLDAIAGLKTRNNLDAPAIQDRQDKVLHVPIADRSFVDDSLYQNRLMLSDIASHVIKGSVGCPYNCVFCVWGPSKFRIREVDSIIEEIEMLIRSTGIQAFTIWDAAFTVVPQRLIEFCEKILNKGIRIQWSCDSRVNVERDLLELMAKAGCYSLSYGVESGSSHILKAINKKINTDQVVAFARNCSEVGIKTEGLFMYSLPDETMEDVELTFHLIKEVLRYSQAIAGNLTLIYPGTDLEIMAKDRGVLPQDFSWNLPYYSEESRSLGVFPEMPVYREKLSLADLEHIRSRLGTYWLVHRNDFSIPMLLKAFIREVRLGQFKRDGFAKIRTASGVLFDKWKRGSVHK